VSETIGDVLAAHAAAQPDAPLLISPETGRSLSYGKLADTTQRLATYLAARGIAPGATVALHLHNGTQTAALFIGLMAAGYIVAPLNLLSQEMQLAPVLTHSEARLVFGCAAHEGLLRAAVARLNAPPEIVIIDIDAMDIFPAASARARARSVAADIALLMYTSGTTGAPKGVLLSHANLLASARAVAAWHSLTPQDRVLSSLPLYHINGQVIATLAPFVSGGSIVTPHRFSAGQWWEQVEKHRCTWINMVPTIIAYLLAGSETRKVSNVRFGRSASAPLPPDQHKAFEDRFGIPVIEAMGMTECASTVFCNPHDVRRRYGSPGLPCGVEAAVIDDVGRHLATGATGELVLRGPNVMTGYFKAPDKTEEAIDASGWLRTGDLGYRDADGFYFVTGRLKELIIKGGENIAPREIDEALLRHPDILEAAAFAIEDDVYGQDIAVALVLKPDAIFDQAGLAAHCRVELGKYKSPRRWHVVSELPKGPSGKVQRLKLADLLGA
jgi:acyl-CoA synthetase (AMP-forming)/AMP-acid ligase II